MKRYSNLLRCVSIFCVCGLCFLLSACGQQDLEEELNEGRIIPPEDSIVWLSSDNSSIEAPYRLSKSDFFRDAMQVPLGQVQIADESLKALRRLSPEYDDAVFGFAVSLGGMLPSNTAISQKVIIRAFQKARPFFEKVGISVEFSEKFTLIYGVFFVYATKEQIQSVTCDRTAALYLYWSRKPLMPAAHSPDANYGM